MVSRRKFGGVLAGSVVALSGCMSQSDRDQSQNEDSVPEWVPETWQSGLQLVPNTNTETDPFEYSVSFVSRSYPADPVRVEVTARNSGDVPVTLDQNPQRLFEFSESSTGSYRVFPVDYLEDNMVVFDESMGVWRMTEPFAQFQNQEQVTVRPEGSVTRELVLVYVGQEKDSSVEGLRVPQVFSTLFEVAETETTVEYQFAIHYQD